MLVLPGASPFNNPLALCTLSVWKTDCSWWKCGWATTKSFFFFFLIPVSQLSAFEADLNEAACCGRWRMGFGTDWIWDEISILSFVICATTALDNVPNYPEPQFSHLKVETFLPYRKAPSSFSGSLICQALSPLGEPGTCSCQHHHR